MIQLWVLPETSGEPAAYQIFEPKKGERKRIYGGPAEQNDTFAARTIIEIAEVDSGDKLTQAGKSLVYMTTGVGEMDSDSNDAQIVREGDLVESTNFRFTAKGDSKLIIIYEQ